MTALAPAENTTFAQDTMIPAAGFHGLRVECTKRVHDLVERNRLASFGERPPQSGYGHDGACIRYPGGQNRALLVQREVRIIDNIRRVRKRLRRMEQIIEIK
jgi:hypothetical protein